MSPEVLEEEKLLEERKARFWERHSRTPLNERQIKVLQRVMEDDWKGKLTSSKWATTTGPSGGRPART